SSNRSVIFSARGKICSRPNTSSSVSGKSCGNSLKPDCAGGSSRLKALVCQMQKERAAVSNMPRGSGYSLLMKLLRVSRGLFPASVRARVRILLFRWLDLTWELPSGLHLRVASYGDLMICDWIIYNEIFVRGEYDQALSIALGSAADNDSPLHIVDLGANVGFFTLHAVDRLRQRGRASEEFMITAVEGNERCIKEFQARVF